MAGTLPDLVCCPDPCASPTTVEVPGPPGDDGTPGTPGAAGTPAYTTFGANFTMPAEGASAVATVGSTAWMAVDQVLFGAKSDGSVRGNLQVMAIGGPTAVTLKNLKNTGTGAYPDNSAPGSVFTVGSQLTAGGVQGPAGTVAGTAVGGDLKGTLPNPKISVANTKGSIPVGNGTDTTAFPAGTNGHLISYLSTAGNGVQATKLLPLTADADVADNRVARLDRPAGTEVPSPLQASKLTILDSGAIRADGSGGNARGTDAVDLQVNRAAVGQVASGNRSVIVGGEKNSSLGTECVVVGGDSNIAGAGGGANDHAAVVGGNDNNASGDGAFIGGGDTNSATAQEAVCSGGNHNTASGIQSVVGGGDTNTATAEEATVAGGGNNGATAINSAVGGGTTNGAFAAYATVPGGNRAVADHYGQMSWASGGFSNVPGTAQVSEFVMRNNTTDATPTELFLDGSGTRLTVPASKSWMFEISLVVRTSAGLDSIYTSIGVIRNNAGTTSVSAVTTTEVFDGAGLPATPVVVSADDPNDSLKILCTGIAATNIRWVARVRVVEVLF